MKQQSLRRLSKTDLLMMLRDQEKEIEELKKKNELLKKKLESKIIIKDTAGSLAEASLALTKIFEEAQNAVDLYLENLVPSGKETVKQMIADSRNENNNGTGITVKGNDSE